MYAFVLELSSKGERPIFGGNWLTRIEDEYSKRLLHKSVAVARLANGRYEVGFEHEDYNFNWCFDVSDDLKIEAIELTIPNVVIPSAGRDRLHSHENGFFRAFPDAARFPHLCCHLTIDPLRRFIRVRTEIGGEYPLDEYRRGMFSVVHGLMNLGQMAKWLDRLVDAHQESNYGKADRAISNLRRTMSRSAPFLTLP